MQETLAEIKSILRGMWNFRWLGLLTAVAVGLIGGATRLLGGHGRVMPLTDRRVISAAVASACEAGRVARPAP